MKRAGPGRLLNPPVGLREAEDRGQGFYALYFDGDFDTPWEQKKYVDATPPPPKKRTQDIHEV